jgi:hypothetical protein
MSQSLSEVIASEDPRRIRSKYIEIVKGFAITNEAVTTTASAQLCALELQRLAIERL